MQKLKYIDSYYLPSGRIFLWETLTGYKIESTEMKDVAVDGKLHKEVRESLDPKVVWKHLVHKRDKWLMTVSTQMGCVHNCKFCDVAPLNFNGNLTYSEIFEQIENMLAVEPSIMFDDNYQFNKIKLGFARMGEPAHNLDNVLSVIEQLPLVKGNRIKWLPCFNSILPKTTLGGYSAEDVILKVLEVKEKNYDGFLHFQISCNSTDEEKRKELFGNANVLSIEEIINIINKQKIHNRTVTLNFIVMKDVPIDIDYLVKLGLNHQKFAVKLIPLNNTLNSERNNLEMQYNYSTYDELKKYAKKFEEANIPVVYDAIAKCEESGLCCGQLANLYQ